MHSKAILAASIAITGLLADSSCASATAYTFTTLDVSGAANTRAFGINDLGQIVGFFNTSTEGHGFLYFRRELYFHRPARGIRKVGR